MQVALQRAVNYWRDGSPVPLSFAVQMGDIIDGYAKENAEKALDGILEELGGLGKKTYHMCVALYALIHAGMHACVFIYVCVCV
jgi:hypothetical protein